MTDTRQTEHWTRPYWHATGEDAALLFFVFGQFSGATDALTTALDLPAGIKLTRHAHASLKAWDGYPLAGSLGNLFAHDAPEILAAARATPEVLRLAGEVRDPSDLDYLRGTLNAVTRLLDAGGAAVVDPMLAAIFDRHSWRQQFLSGTTTTLRHHVLVTCAPDPDADACQWVHTRGMRKFARPDISLTRVPTSDTQQAGALCEKLIDLLALGSQFADGQILQVDGLRGPLAIHTGGAMDDARFHNTHIELRWPA